MDKIINEILAELAAAEAKHSWVGNSLETNTLIMSEEAGEVVRAVVRHKLEGHSIEDVRSELIQTGAMVLRMLKNLPVPEEKTPFIHSTGFQTSEKLVKEWWDGLSEVHRGKSPLQDYFKLDTSEPITEAVPTVHDVLKSYLDQSIKRLDRKTQSVKTINASKLYVCKECNCFLFNHGKCISCKTPADPKPEEQVQLGCSQCTGSNSGTGRCIYCNPIKTT